MAILIKIGSNFLVKLQNTTSFFLTAFFEFFSESTLSRICSFKSLWGADYLRWKKLKSSRCHIISYTPIIKKEMVLDIWWLKHIIWTSTKLLRSQPLGYQDLVKKTCTGRLIANVFSLDPNVNSFWNWTCQMRNNAITEI